MVLAGPVTQWVAGPASFRLPIAFSSQEKSECPSTSPATIAQPFTRSSTTGASHTLLFLHRPKHKDVDTQRLVDVRKALGSAGYGPGTPAFDER